jgi:hypothetical protein
MKLFIRNLVLGAMLTCWTGLVLAESNTNASGVKPPMRIKMDCEIVKVNAAARTVEVKMDDKTETLSLSEKCKVKIDGQDKTLADLKPGQKCHCTCYEKKEGGKSVSRIVVGDEKEESKSKKPTP